MKKFGYGSGHLDDQQEVEEESETDEKIRGKSRDTSLTTRVLTLITAEAIAASRLPLRIRLPPVVGFQRHEASPVLGDSNDEGDETDDSKQERSVSRARDSRSKAKAVGGFSHTRATKRKERASTYDQCSEENESANDSRPRKKYSREGRHAKGKAVVSAKPSKRPRGRPRKDDRQDDNKPESRPFSTSVFIAIPVPAKLVRGRTSKGDKYVKQASRMEGPFTFGWLMTWKQFLA